MFGSQYAIYSLSGYRFLNAPCYQGEGVISKRRLEQFHADPSLSSGAAEATVATAFWVHSCELLNHLGVWSQDRNHQKLDNLVTPADVVILVAVVVQLHPDASGVVDIDDTFPPLILWMGSLAPRTG